MSFVRNLSSQWLATAYIAGASLALSIALGRLMGPESFGLYNYVLGLAAIYGIFQDGGFRTFMMREKSQASTDIKTVEEKLVPLSFGHLIAVTILGVLLSVILFEDERVIVALAVLVTGGKVLSGFVSAYLRGEGAFVADARWQMMVRSLTAVSVITSWLIWERLDLVLLSWLGGQVLSMGFPAARRYLRRPMFGISRTFLRTGIAFLTIEAATALYFRIDIILLEYILGESSITGNYSAAYRLLEGVIFLMTPLSLIFFRYLRLSRQDIEDFRHLLLLQLAVMVIMAICIFAFVWFLGGLIVAFTFGEAFAPAGTILSLLFASLIFILPNSVMTQAFVALNREWAFASMAVGAALINIGLNFWLIPKYQMWGAAWATLGTEAFLLLSLSIVYFIIRKKTCS